jgi:hypothetical protein
MNSSTIIIEKIPPAPPIPPVSENHEGKSKQKSLKAFQPMEALYLRWTKYLQPKIHRITFKTRD